jgi:predicted nucleic-acid-binding Zn-ribbon protein
MTDSFHKAELISEEEMDSLPAQEKVIDIQGVQGESVFYSVMYFCASPGTVTGLQQRIDKTLEYVQGLNDDRLLILIGALLVENAVHELLASIMPGYRSLQSNRDFTFSMQIEIAKALKLIPGKILNSADFVRKLRNEFVHNLAVDSFEKLPSSKLQSLQDRLRDFGPEVIEDDARAFRRLVLWVVVGLHVYTLHTSLLNEFVRDKDLLKNLESFANQENPDDGGKDVSMSESQKAQVYDHLRSAGVSSLCPACSQHVEWKQGSFVTVLGLSADLSLDASKGIPLIPAICKNCGYVRFFSAKSIGLV